MTYREQEQIFDMVADAIDNSAVSMKELMVDRLNKLATGYEEAAERQRSKSPEFSSVCVIRAQGIREAIKAIEG